MFIDDDRQNIQKAMSYSLTVLISPRSGMTLDHMKQIEEKCKVYPISMELTTPKTVKKEISKHYPSQKMDKLNMDKTNNLEKYKIVSVPKWFDNLSNPINDTPVIQIGGDQTPCSESGEYELTVPMLNDNIAEIGGSKKEKQKNGLSLNLNPDDTTSDYEEDENNEQPQEQQQENKE